MPNVFETPPPEFPVKGPDGKVVGVGRLVDGEIEVDIDADDLLTVMKSGVIQGVSYEPFSNTAQVIINNKNQKEQDNG